MFGQVQEHPPTDRVSCHSPKWVSCDGMVIADGDVFLPLWGFDSR
jgi:hypothetical protein